jgi:tight adherence protein C
MTTPQGTSFFLIFALSVGLAVGLLAWLISHYIAHIPAEDREYKDRPPLGFRLAWAPIQWLAYTIAPFITAKSQAHSFNQLKKGGLDYSLSPQQYMAARIWCALAAGLIFWWAVASFDHPAPGEPGTTLGAYRNAILSGALLGYFYPALWLRDHLGRRQRELLKSLPFFLDIITLCVEAGLNMQGAMTQAVAKGPQGVMRDEFQRVLRDIRAGKSRADSLRSLIERANEPAVTNFCTAVIQAESMGMSLGPLLRAQADQRRVERFLRAEKLAMEAPVKMLFPLIVFIFPCTFMVLFFPIAMKFMHSGL